MPLRALPPDLPMAALGGPITRLPEPLPVQAWVLFPRTGYVRVDGEATAYTPRAGHIRFHDEDGRTGSVWVWANAITRR